MSATRQPLYDIALNSQGFILDRTPKNPAIDTKQLAIFDRRFSQGDRSFSDFSRWWFTAQQAFDSGIKERLAWADDGKFLNGRGIDAFSEPGRVSVLPATTSKKDFGTTDFSLLTAGEFDFVQGDERLLLGVEGKIGIESAIWETKDGSAFTNITDAAIDVGNFWHAAVIRAIKRMPFDDKFHIVSDDTDWMFSTWDGATHADITAAVRGVDSSAGGQGLAIAGGRGWFAFTNAASDLIIKSSDDGITYTKRITLKYGVWQGGVERAGNLLYLVTYQSNILELREYDVANDSDSLIKRFVGKGLFDGTHTLKGRDHRINSLDGTTAYFLTDDGSIYSYNGTDLKLIFENVGSMIPANVGFGLIEHRSRLYGPNVVIDQNGNIFPGHFDGVVDNILPIASVKFLPNVDPVLWAGSDKNTANKVKLFALDSGNAVSARMDLSNMDGLIENIDKLLYSVTLSFDAFTTNGQSIELLYGLDGAAPVTSIGLATQSDDGAISSKEFLFGDDILGKSVGLRALMVNATGAVATTPKLKAVLLKFMPFPDYRTQWTMRLKCIDSILLKDGKSKEDKTGEYLRALVRNAWWTRGLVEFEDFDGAEVDLDGNLTAIATTIPIQQATDRFPEIGRIKIDNEEILYSGKTKTSLLNCTRGARGSVAATHSDGDSITTLYKVIITDFREELLFNNNVNVREYNTTITLIEA